MLAFDLDGVVVDFVNGFTRLANQLHGTPILAGGGQRTWDFRDEMTPEQQKETWRVVDESPDFWYALPSILTEGEEALLRDFMRRERAVFLTNRKPYTEKQTHRWVTEMFGDHWTIIHAKNKAKAAVELGVTTIVEDSPTNIPELQWVVPEVIIRDYPYNRHVDGIRMSSMGEVLAHLQAK